MLYRSLFSILLCLLSVCQTGAAERSDHPQAQEGRPCVITSRYEGADVYLDGKRVGVCPHHCILPTGTHWVYAVEDGQTSSITHVKVKRGENGVLSVQLIFHDFIDLALPSGTMWATCNVGADRPEEYGQYFAWAETRPTGEDTTSEYTFKSKMTPRDDAAFVHWGSQWCIPSLDQLKELVDKRYTIPLWTVVGDVNGLLVKSRKNGNSIFLPAGGYSNNGTPSELNKVGNYWSSNGGGSFTNAAFELFFYDNEIDVDFCDRIYGRSIRPVLNTK